MKTAFFLIAAVLASVVPLSARTITAAEYYFNTDPGPGKGTPIPVEAAETVRLTVNVPPAMIAALPDGGVHFLTCRVRDEEGNWSIAFSRPVHKQDPGPDQTEAPVVVAAEYYINTDPGPGKGTPIPVEAALSPRLTVDVLSATLAALPEGVHFLTCRVRDAQGDWSVAFSRPFHKEAPAPAAPMLARVEYRWHRDGQPIAEAVSLNAAPNTVSAAWLRESPMPAGQQGDAFQLVFTPYDSAGNRGISATRKVTLAPPPTLAETLAAALPGASPQDLAPEGNPLGDAFNNLQKYYLGLDPTKVEGESAVSLVVPETGAAARRAPRSGGIVTHSENSGNQIGLQFQRSRYTQRVTGIVESSSSLTEDSWEPVKTTEEVTPLDAFTDTVTIRLPPPGQGETRRFLRLRVKGTAP